MQKNNFLSNIGLCARASGCVWGSENCLEQIRSDRMKLLFLDEQASDNTKKRFTDACLFRQVPLFLFDSKQWDIARAIGRPKSKVIGILAETWKKPLYEQAIQFQIASLFQGGNV